MDSALVSVLGSGVDHPKHWSLCPERRQLFDMMFYHSIRIPNKDKNWYLIMTDKTLYFGMIAVAFEL